MATRCCPQKTLISSPACAISCVSVLNGFQARKKYLYTETGWGKKKTKKTVLAAHVPCSVVPWDPLLCTSFVLGQQRMLSPLSTALSEWRASVSGVLPGPIQRCFFLAGSLGPVAEGAQKTIGALFICMRKRSLVITGSCHTIGRILCDYTNHNKVYAHIFFFVSSVPSNPCAPCGSVKCALNSSFPTC